MNEDKALEYREVEAGADQRCKVEGSADQRCSVEDGADQRCSVEDGANLLCRVEISADQRCFTRYKVFKQFIFTGLWFSLVSIVWRYDKHCVTVRLAARL